MATWCAFGDILKMTENAAVAELRQLVNHIISHADMYCLQSTQNYQVELFYAL